MTVDLKTLLEIVGVDGARAALKASTTLAAKDLRALPGAAPLPPSATRAEIVDAILAPHDNRIDRPLAELQRLPEAEVAEYLKATRCSDAEIMLFLDRANIPYPRGLSKSRLIAEAAREISRLGLFDHITGGPTRISSERLPERPREHGGAIDGIWYSELGAKIVFRVEANTLHGSYQKPDGTEHAIIGMLGAELSSTRRLASFSVIWSDGTASSPAVSTWAGYFDNSGTQIAVHTWLLVEASTRPNRITTAVGKEILRRSPPELEHLDFAKKFNDRSFPFRGRD